MSIRSQPIFDGLRHAAARFLGEGHEASLQPADCQAAQARTPIDRTIASSAPRQMVSSPPSAPGRHEAGQAPWTPGPAPPAHHHAGAPGDSARSRGVQADAAEPDGRAVSAEDAGSTRGGFFTDVPPRLMPFSDNSIGPRRQGKCGVLAARAFHEDASIGLAQTLDGCA